ncbi:MAG TPA: S46 family peptidase [Candidatus Deferrimicrobium sp.]|nr:S46 family peptidase [Candidatus Deferrimicrobium sp.]
MFRLLCALPSLFTYFILTSATFADEGMWPLYMIDGLNWDSLHARGLKLKPNDIYNPAAGGLADAVVQLGATGSFVSPDGLILTNHHVAFGAIQEQSTLNQNYLRDGFYAAAREQELPALGYRAYVTLSIQDVTDRILGVVSDTMTSLERFKAIDRAIKELIKETESGRDVKARVAAMYGGKQYMLYTMLEIRDIRIVYVPPEAIGNFGGDIDNWMWPRHVGDFSFLRAYVTPDGRPADNAPENVPYRPKVYLGISTEGVREGDFAMTLGFPGGTDRYISSYDLANQIDFSYPNSIAVLEDQIGIIQLAGERDSAIELRMASDMAGLQNWLKNAYGTLEGFRKKDILVYKRDQERQLSQFIQSQRALFEQYGDVLPELDSLYRARLRYQARDFALGRMSWGCDYLRLATSLYRWACEREKPDLERERGYQDRDTLTAKERMKNAQINLVPAVDKELLKYFLGKALELAPEQRIDAIERLAAEQENKQQHLNQIVEQLYIDTKVGSADQRLAMFAMSRTELEALNDPFINLAKALKPDMDSLLEHNKEFDGAQQRLTPRLIQAYAEWKKQEMYPDANGTMRLSYGEVKSYSPRDATSHFYQTGLRGVMEKETDKEPFVVPAALSQAYRDNDFGGYVDPVIHDVPVDFLTTNDITGGNSGSPVINGKGKIIGLAFDGNWEGIASDYLFNPPLTRTIAVDIRYVMFLIDRVYHLDDLVHELRSASAARL